MAKSATPIKAKPASPRAHVYLTSTELSAIKQRAAAERIGVSAYIRRSALRDIQRPASS